MFPFILSYFQLRLSKHIDFFNMFLFYINIRFSIFIFVSDSKLDHPCSSFCAVIPTHIPVALQPNTFQRRWTSHVTPKNAHRHSFLKQTPLTKKVADNFELNNLTSAITFRNCYPEERYVMDDNLLESEISRKVLLHDAHKIDFLQGEVDRLAAVSEAAVAKVAEERQCKPDQFHFTWGSLRTSSSSLNLFISLPPSTP